MQVGGVLGALVGAGVLPLKEVATATLEAAVEEEGEDGQLVDGGCAWKLMGAVLQGVAQNSNQAQMSKQWKDTGLQLDAFFPSVRPLAHLHNCASFCERNTFMLLFVRLFIHSFADSCIRLLAQLMVCSSSLLICKKSPLLLCAAHGTFRLHCQRAELCTQWRFFVCGCRVRDRTYMVR